MAVNCFVSPGASVGCAGCTVIDFRLALPLPLPPLPPLPPFPPLPPLPLEVLSLLRHPVMDTAMDNIVRMASERAMRIRLLTDPGTTASMEGSIQQRFQQLRFQICSVKCKWLQNVSLT